MKITKLKPIVLDILTNNPETRKNDNLLIIKVLHEYTKGRVNINTPFIDFIYYVKVPSFESITRARRALQKMYPELKDFKMTEIRKIEEQKYYEEFKK